MGGLLSYAQSLCQERWEAGLDNLSLGGNIIVLQEVEPYAHVLGVQDDQGGDGQSSAILTAAPNIEHEMSAGFYIENITVVDLSFPYFLPVVVVSICRADVGVTNEAKRISRGGIIVDQGFEGVSRLEGVEDIIIWIEGRSVKQVEGMLDLQLVRER